jgi:hypothetical protein
VVPAPLWRYIGLYTHYCNIAEEASEESAEEDYKEELISRMFIVYARIFL